MSGEERRKELLTLIWSNTSPVSGTVLAGQAMAKLLNISHVAGMLIFSAIIIVIAVLGYKVIHKLGKLASIVGILAFVYMFITLLLSADLSALAHNNHFSLPTFLGGFAPASSVTSSINSAPTPQMGQEAGGSSDSKISPQMVQRYLRMGEPPLISIWFRQQYTMKNSA